MSFLEFVKNVRSAGNDYVDPYVIAEAGVNHEGSIDTAKRLIDEAQEGGASAIKFQSYKADTLAVKDSPSYWDTSQEATKSQHELFSKHDSFWKNEMVELREYCDKQKIDFMSTPFDKESAVFLNDLMEVYKISSSDLTNKPFVEFICGFNKPVILSTGASHLWEIERTLSWMEVFGVDVSLLHCVLNYPTSDEDANLGVITSLKKQFPQRIIGYSDHTLPQDMKVCELAYMLGSLIIEKHFTHNKALPGNDHYHAMDKADLKKFINMLSRNKHLLGSSQIKALCKEQAARDNARRSIVSACEISAGEIISEEHLTFKRPATGVSPAYWNDVIGKKALENISADQIIKWNMLDG